MVCVSQIGVLKASIDVLSHLAIWVEPPAGAKRIPKRKSVQSFRVQQAGHLKQRFCWSYDVFLLIS